MPNGIMYPCARFGTENRLPIYDSNTNVWHENNYNFLLDTKLTNPKTFDKCKECKLYEVCNSGCTYNQIKNGIKGEPIDSICKLYFILYNEAIRIYDKLKNNDYKSKVYGGF